jgi:tRNA(Ile)-lysidine synthase
LATPARREHDQFGPAWLSVQLARLLPAYPGVRLCVAFSGGLDSTALLAACAQLKRPGPKLRAVHIDHQLQAGSGQWAAHCRRIARKLGVPLRVRNVTVARTRGTSLEAAAREARYAALASLLQPGEVLLTAHHEDDQLETVLLQLLRGAGVAGLSAMPQVAPFAAGSLARPLLEVTHQELGAWLATQRLAHVEDPSNAQLHLDRNYLRAKVLPQVRARWPAASATVARSARHAAQAQRLLDALAAADLAKGVVGEALSARVLRTLPADRRVNALRFWIAQAGLLAPPTRRLEEIAGALLDARPDSRPQVSWEGAGVRREAQLLWLRAAAPAIAKAAVAVTGEAGGGAQPTAEVKWHWGRKRTCPLPKELGTLALRADPRGPLDLDALPPVLKVRGRRGGERLRPVRGGTRRALKGLLQEARVPVEVRAQLPLVFAAQVLVAVADLWLDESVQAGADSTRRARLLWQAPV